MAPLDTSGGPLYQLSMSKYGTTFSGAVVVEISANDYCFDCSE
jgi:hypothetical protein